MEKLKMVTFLWYTILLTSIYPFDLVSSAQKSNRRHIETDHKTEQNCHSFDSLSREEFAKRIARWNAEADKLARKSAIASWNWATNITEENAKQSREVDLQTSAVYQKNWKEARCTKDCKDCSPELRRQLLLYQSGIGTSALSEEQLSEFQQIVQGMKSIYSKAKLCNITGYSPDVCMSLEPDLTKLIRKQGDYCFLADIWKRWRDASGKKIRDLFTQYVWYLNKAALLNGYNNAQEMWLSDYARDSPTFLDDVISLWNEVKPFYQHLHAFVRSKLIKLYGKDKFPSSGHIPAHLHGNMWSQSWEPLITLVLPEPKTKFINLTDSLIRNSFTVNSMFKAADEFFQSIGMPPMTADFWNKSVFTKPSDVDMVCHASAWDMGEKNDFRIKMCTVIDGSDFQVVHHEMGHISYYQNYSPQPRPFRGGANSGFHEAVGDLIAISAMNPLHLKALGLVSDNELNDQNEDAVFLNALMQRALAKVAFLPFGLLIDSYRYGIFNGTTPSERLNAEWWKLRCSLQGISPPFPRSEDDFDAGSKYHVAASSQYINYFVAAFLQFDFHENICRRIGFTENFHKCDIWRNPKAAEVLRTMLALGKSKPHPEALKVMTGGRDRMSAGPMLRFFKPLHDWLIKENAKHGETIGWDESKCPEPTFTCSAN